MEFENNQGLIQVIKNEVEISLNLLPDAIFIPSNGRIKNLNRLLNELSFFENMIYILETEEINLTNLKSNVKVVIPNESLEFKWIKQLRSFSNQSYSEYNTWDLPLKRNYSIIKSLEYGYQNILIIDDDITKFDLKNIQICTYFINKCEIVGSLIEGFADTSTIGHIELLNGETYFPFLSGSFLLINLEKTKSHFPQIYNEDWLFMIPSILNKSILAYKNVFQTEYNPFTIDRIRHQERGEIITEGLFSLIKSDAYSNRFDDSFWNFFIKERIIYLELLKNKVSIEHKSLINEALLISRGIKSMECTSIITDIEEDNLKFVNFINKSFK